MLTQAPGWSAGLLELAGARPRGLPAAVNAPDDSWSAAPARTVQQERVPGPAACPKPEPATAECLLEDCTSLLDLGPDSLFAVGGGRHSPPLSASWTPSPAQSLAESDCPASTPPESPLGTPTDTGSVIGSHQPGAGTARAELPLPSSPPISSDLDLDLEADMADAPQPLAATGDDKLRSLLSDVAAATASPAPMQLAQQPGAAPTGSGLMLPFFEVWAASQQARLGAHPDPRAQGPTIGDFGAATSILDTLGLFPPLDAGPSPAAPAAVATPAPSMASMAAMASMTTSQHHHAHANVSSAPILPHPAFVRTPGWPSAMMGSSRDQDPYPALTTTLLPFQQALPNSHTQPAPAAASTPTPNPSARSTRRRHRANSLALGGDPDDLDDSAPQRIISNSSRGRARKLTPAAAAAAAAAPLMTTEPKPRAKKPRCGAGSKRKSSRPRRVCVVCAGPAPGASSYCRICYSGVNNDVRKMFHTCTVEVAKQLAAAQSLEEAAAVFASLFKQTPTFSCPSGFACPPAAYARSSRKDKCLRCRTLAVVRAVPEMVIPIVYRAAGRKFGIAPPAFLSLPDDHIIPVLEPVTNDITTAAAPVTSFQT